MHRVLVGYLGLAEPGEIEHTGSPSVSNCMLPELVVECNGALRAMTSVSRVCMNGW